jgi:hypothetical protein
LLLQQLRLWIVAYVLSNHNVVGTRKDATWLLLLLLLLHLTVLCRLLLLLLLLLLLGAMEATLRLHQLPRHSRTQLLLLLLLLLLRRLALVAAMLLCRTMLLLLVLLGGVGRLWQGLLLLLLQLWRLTVKLCWSLLYHRARLRRVVLLLLLLLLLLCSWFVLPLLRCHMYCPSWRRLVKPRRWLLLLLLVRHTVWSSLYSCAGRRLVKPRHLLLLLLAVWLLLLYWCLPIWQLLSA